MRSSSVELVGEFERAETGFLRDSFDHCRIELLARSKLDPAIALLRWSPRVAGSDQRVTDRRRVPPAAYYVLVPAHREFELTPVHSQRELDQRYSGHFDEGLLPETQPGRGCLLRSLFWPWF